MKHNWLTLLYKSLDQELSPSESAVLEKALADSEELRQEQARINVVRSDVAGSAAQAFAPGFADRVMVNISLSAHKNQLVSSWKMAVSDVFRPVALAAAITIATLITIGLNSNEQPSLESLFGIPPYTLENIVYATE